MRFLRPNTPHANHSQLGVLNLYLFAHHAVEFFGHLLAQLGMAKPAPFIRHTYLQGLHGIEALLGAYRLPIPKPRLEARRAYRHPLPIGQLGLTRFLRLVIGFTPTQRPLSLTPFLACCANLGFCWCALLACKIAHKGINVCIAFAGLAAPSRFKWRIVHAALLWPLTCQQLPIALLWAYNITPKPVALRIFISLRSLVAFLRRRWRKQLYLLGLSASCSLLGSCWLLFQSEGITSGGSSPGFWFANSVAFISIPRNIPGFSPDSCGIKCISYGWLLYVTENINSGTLHLCPVNEVCHSAKHLRHFVCRTLVRVHVARHIHSIAIPPQHVALGKQPLKRVIVVGRFSNQLKPAHQCFTHIIGQRIVLIQ